MVTFTKKTNPSQGVRIVALIVKNSFLLRKTFNRFLLVSIVVLFSHTVSATVYYVSSSGSDSNSGTSASAPWKTLAKVNNFPSGPNDQILFNPDDASFSSIFVKGSGTSRNTVIYGAYDSSAKPISKDISKVTGWTLHFGNIYKTELTNPIAQSFIESYPLAFARHSDRYSLVDNVFNTVNLQPNLDRLVWKLGDRFLILFTNGKLKL